MSKLKTKPESTHPGSLLVVFLTVFIDLLGFGLVLPLLPVYADAFSTDEAGLEVGLLMASFSAMQFLFAPLWGSLSDKIGRRPTIMLGLAGSVVFYTLFGLATVWHSMTWIFVSRIGAGICGATIPTAQAYIADTTTEETRTRGMALIGIAFGMGFTFGPILGFFALTGTDGELSPLPGFLAAGLSLVAFLFATFLLPESITRDSKSAGRKVIDLPAIRIALKKRTVGMILLALFVYVYSFAMFETTLSLLIKNEPFNYTLKQICGFYAFIGLSLAFIQGGIVRRISHYFTDGQLALSGASIKVIGLLLVAAASYWKSVVPLYASMLVIVIGFSLLQPSINSMLSKSIDQSRYGMIMGLGQSVNSFGRILGAFIGIPLLKIHILLPYLTGAALMFISLAFIPLSKGNNRSSDADTLDSESGYD